MITDCYLWNFGFNYEAKQFGRDEVEFQLQHYAQAVRPGIDYIFQSRPPLDIWQVNGMSPKGAKAAAYVARGFNFLPNRIDVACDIYSEDKTALTLYNNIKERLITFYKREKPSTGIEEFTKPEGLPRLIIGTAKSRYCLMIEVTETEHYEDDLVRIVWSIRRDKVVATYGYIQSYNRASEYGDDCAKAFAAITNSLLKKDFFGLNLYPDLYLVQEVKTDIAPDWWGEVASFCQKVIKQAEKEKSYYLVQETFDFIEKELQAGLVRRIRKSNLTTSIDGKDRITI